MSHSGIGITGLHVASPLAGSARESLAYVLFGAPGLSRLFVENAFVTLQYPHTSCYFAISRSQLSAGVNAVMGGSDGLVDEVGGGRRRATAEKVKRTA